MKKFLLTLIVLTFGLSALASDSEEALSFFNGYVQAANSYSSSLLNMYSDNAKITRQVIKPNGQTVNVPFSIEDYRKQMKISSKLAKLKNYKNHYSKISVTKVANGYKIESLRQPCTDCFKLKATIVVQKQPSGKWLIVEELMQTKEQIFLKYAK